MTESIKQPRSSVARRLVIASNVLMIAAALVMLAATWRHGFTSRHDLLITAAFVLVATAALITLVGVSKRKL